MLLPSRLELSRFGSLPSRKQIKHFPDLGKIVLLQHLVSKSVSDCCDLSCSAASPGCKSGFLTLFLYPAFSVSMNFQLFYFLLCFPEFVCFIFMPPFPELKRRKAKKEKYIHLNAEFQRIARRYKKALFRNQCN